MIIEEFSKLDEMDDTAIELFMEMNQLIEDFQLSCRDVGAVIKILIMYAKAGGDALLLHKIIDDEWDNLIDDYSAGGIRLLGERDFMRLGEKLGATWK